MVVQTVRAFVPWQEVSSNSRSTLQQQEMDISFHPS